MEEGRITFPSMELRKRQYVLLVTNPKVFIYIYSFIISGRFSSNFVKMWMLSILECVCTLFKTGVLCNEGAFERPLCLYYGKILMCEVFYFHLVLFP